MGDHASSSSSSSGPCNEEEPLDATHYTPWPSHWSYSADRSGLLFRPDPSRRFQDYRLRAATLDCPYYMRTGTCIDTCNFNHPKWLPEGGLPELKGVPVFEEPLPERPGREICPLLSGLNKCKYGQSCPFHHPKADDSENTDDSDFLKRPFKSLSMFKDDDKILEHLLHVQREIDGLDDGDGGQIGGLSTPSSTPELLLNSVGLPIRLGAMDCKFYMKNGSCSYGLGCYKNHPERDGAIVAAPASHITHGLVNPALINQTMHGSDSANSNNRPRPCDYYMRKGKCTFKRCKFYHPPKPSDAP